MKTGSIAEPVFFTLQYNYLFQPYSTILLGRLQDGFMLKNTPRAQILAGLRAVTRGKRYIHPEIAIIMADYLNHENGLLHKLSPRESEIADLIRQSYSNREIADRLVISISTVRVHINNIMEKLKVSTRRQIAHSDEEMQGSSG